MPDRFRIVTAELHLHVDDDDLARGIVGQWTTGMPKLEHLRITDVRTASVRTWDDDCANAERGPDRDDNRPVTEPELMRGYGLEVNAAELRRRRLPHALRRDLGGDAA